MTETPEPHDDDAEGLAVRNLVKRALAADTLAKNPPDILRGVQRRIRHRSRGKFFADGWSTTQTRHAYLLVALVTLIFAAIAYYALGPMDIR
ncbi:MAG: hypothetical protein WBY94_07315 [Polyangiaceae bacterium]